MRTHSIEYEGITLATVEIDGEKAAEPIKEMVEFSTSGEDDLAAENGDYTRAWLRRLGRFILRQHAPPRSDDEGWFPLDGTHGIDLVSWEAWEEDDDLFSIR
jgi:hypothetical protein